MIDKNIEMINELRKFVMRVLSEEKNAAPYELECAMEAAKIVVGLDECNKIRCPYKMTQEELAEREVERRRMLGEIYCQ